MSSYAEQLERICACIIHESWASGTIDVPEHFLRLFYLEKANPKSSHTVVLNRSATLDELVGLAEACEPASLEREGEDVVDGSYGKAGKMDKTMFSSLFNLQELNLLESVKRSLFSGPEAEKAVIAELRELNVYGPDSFIESHKDIPSNDKMFGSLVIIFPTIHQGGSLALRHKEKEFIFDSSRLVTESPATSKVAYIAFTSDVEYEALPVISGYRVTLTYNLYHTDSNPGTKRVPVSIDEVLNLKNSISSLLDNDMFLPFGGFLGFGLNFSYPVDKCVRFDDIITRLMGRDEIVKIACTELGLRVNLKGIVFTPENDYFDYRVMSSCPVQDAEYYDSFGGGSLTRVIIDEEDGDMFHTSGEDPREIHDQGDRNDNISKEVFWVTKSKEYSMYESTITRPGPGTFSKVQDSFYVDVCLMVSVGPAGDRTAAYEGVKVC